MSDSGWHPDPQGRHEQRFFDGTAWTAHVLDNGLPSLDPYGDENPGPEFSAAVGAPSESSEAAIASEPDAATERSAEAARAGGLRPWVIASICGIVVVGILVAVLVAGSHSKQVTVKGTFAISNGSYDATNEFATANFQSDGSGGCEGNSGYGDLNSITQVVVADNHGKELTRTELGSGEQSGDSTSTTATCTFTFTFKVKKGPSYYVVSVGHRGSSQYTFDQIQEPDAVALVIGNQ